MPFHQRPAFCRPNSSSSAASLALFLALVLTVGNLDMSRRIATAFQTANRALALETRTETLGIYRSLLRVCLPLPYNNTAKQLITEKFKANRHNTSRPQVLKLLQEANKTLEYFKQATSGNKEIAQKIEDYVRLSYNAKKTAVGGKTQTEACTATDKAASQPSKRKKSKITKRKPYQVAILTQTSHGFKFKRVRGWRQPVRTAMMLKKRIKRLQSDLDRFNQLQDYLEMIKAEKIFLRELGCLPEDKLQGFETTIKAGMAKYFRYKIRNRPQLPDDLEK